MKTIDFKFENTDNYYNREAFKSLRTNVQFCGTDVKVITLTSCDANEGKTTITLELARAMAESGKRVLVIDADMRKSVMMSRYAEGVGYMGLSQYLSGMAEIEDVVFTAQNEKFDVIFAGKYPPNPVELLGGTRFAQLLESKKTKYDYIFIDTPPLGMVIDSAVVAAMCDSAIIVVSVGRIKYRLLQNVKAQLEKSGCRILGVVLNHTVKKKGSYYKKYYGKYQGYGYYSKYTENKEEVRQQIK